MGKASVNSHMSLLIVYTVWKRSCKKNIKNRIIMIDKQYYTTYNIVESYSKSHERSVLHGI